MVCGGGAEMKILFLHGWKSVPGGVKPTWLREHGHVVANPHLSDDDFAAALGTAQAEFDRLQPDVVVGSSRGGALAMNLSAPAARLVLLCPAWKKWGSAQRVPPDTIILHSRADEVIPFADSEELASRSGAVLIETGVDHRLADPEPLAALLRACVEGAR
jgi:Alpha/beta hydrolase family